MERRIIASFLGFMNRIRSDRMETWSPKLRKIDKIELHILLHVQENPDIRIGEIREKLDIPNSTLTGIINRMEKKNLLRRIITGDKRSYGLELMDEGLRIRREHDRVLHMIAETMLEALTPSDQETFINLLDKVSASLPEKGPIPKRRHQ
jgi:DNA-binding MarR family transcriptional regulator